jgi:azurin
MNRRLFVIYAAIFISCLLSFILPLRHQRSTEYTPQQTQKETAENPPTQQAGTAGVPALQAGVDPTQATQHFEIQALKNIPGFDQTELTAKTTDIIALTFRNLSDPKLHYFHGWVLTRPDRADAVEIAADRAGRQSQFLPDTPDVLARSTRLLRSGESETIYFRAPSEPGDYPYICPFPGHGAAMRGVLHIRAP